jgi:hypothetical protein
MLAVRLQELAPDHAIFEQTAFTDEAMDKLTSLSSQQSQKMHGLYKETRNNNIRLQVCVCLTSSRGGLPFDAVSTAR